MAKFQLLLPKMGESVAEATIIRWLKTTGDMVQADEALMEIATDKVDSEIPSPVSGRLAAQLCKENDVVQVGDIIGIIDVIDTPVAQQVPVSPAPQPAPVQQESFPINDTVEFEERQIPGMNQLVPETPLAQPAFINTERFYSPLVKNIASHEGITTAELDKIPGTGADGRLTKDDLLNYISKKQTVMASKAPIATPQPMQQVPVAAPKPVEQASVQQPLPPIAAAVPTPVQPAPKPASPMPATAQQQAPQVPKPVEQASPIPVPKALQPEKAAIPESKQTEHSGSLPPKNQQVSPENPTPTPQPTVQSKATYAVSPGDEIIEMDRMRKLIADHMVMSKHTSPHVTSFVEADVTNLVKWRERVKKGFEAKTGERITFTPIFIEAVVKAIKDMPLINSSVNGTQIIKKKDINIGMATALPSGNLIVPVIHKADTLNLTGLTKAVNDLAIRARSNKLVPDEIKNGTFTITNVGTFGNVMGTPIINQPQVAILALGIIKKKPAVMETKDGDVIAIRHMMYLSLSYDHRVVDGALGGSFIRRVADYLENWDAGREL
jgi:2-oxoglutarate dehydrogenase E2 component (dihydrolipoamide succinyltransferase)